LSCRKKVEDRVPQNFFDTKDKLKLITKRAITTHNSWTHNIEEFVSRERGTNHLYMHPEDAARAGLAEGDLADVSTETGAVRIPVKILPELMPGSVALPHGWGHHISHTRHSILGPHLLGCPGAAF